MFSNVISPKNPTSFCCNICDYNTSRKKDYDKHIHTIKHISNAKQSLLDDNSNPKSPPNVFAPVIKPIKSPKKSQKVPKSHQSITHHKTYMCLCGKLYADNSGLWRHKKNCFKINIESNIGSNIESNNEKLIQDKPTHLTDKELIMLLINENKDFKQMILDQNKTIIELSKNPVNITTNNNNTNNSHNKTFNLQFFLNEECKDALNISEFVSSIKVELGDLETTGRLGYVEGVSRIINKNLNDLDQSKRPIHCSDLKREVLYIKNDDQWTKEDETRPILKKAIKQVANENIKQIGEWRKKYPDCMDSDSRKNDTYLKIVSNSMSGLTSDEQSKNINKIVTNVAKETVIDK